VEPIKKQASTYSWTATQIKNWQQSMTVDESTSSNAAILVLRLIVGYGLANAYTKSHSRCTAFMLWRSKELKSSVS
jgi:hypothetical protein